MPPQTIETIAASIFPHHSMSYRTLATGKSYNNRIYFLTMVPKTSPGETHECVLKVNGRFFGAPKVQNEVSCLRLLEKFCPDVPAPRIVAWSEDGDEGVLASGAALRNYSPTRPDPGSTRPHNGWILMTKVPGEPIPVSDLDEGTLTRLSRDLADLVSQWRQIVPAQLNCGSLRFHKDYDTAPVDISLGSSEDRDLLDLVIRGSVGDGLDLKQSLPTLSDYISAKIEDKLQQLETSQTYLPNRELAPLLHSFIAKTLPNLRFTKTISPTDRGFIFTHYDLSPRNILVSGSPLQITGIVDFEFAGFFSPMEEFLNDSVGNDGDWPEAVYSQYLERLKENGLDTPVHGIAKDDWDQAKLLEELIQNIAPWWLPGDYSEDRIKEELEKAKLSVQETLGKLGHTE